MRGPPSPSPPPPTTWFTIVLVGATVVVVLASPWPAPSVLVLAVLGCTVSVARGHVHLSDIGDAVDVGVLVGLFGLAVALGTGARILDGPASVLSTAGAPVTMAMAAGLAVLVNNLPAAALLSAGPVAHQRALLLGLNLGPNLAVTGSLSALIWYKAARTVGMSPDWRTVSRVGVVLAPACLVAAGLAAAVVSAGSF